MDTLAPAATTTWANSRLSRLIFVKSKFLAVMVSVRSESITLIV